MLLRRFPGPGGPGRKWIRSIVPSLVTLSNGISVSIGRPHLDITQVCKHGACTANVCPRVRCLCSKCVHKHGSCTANVCASTALVQLFTILFWSRFSSLLNSLSPISLLIFNDIILSSGILLIYSIFVSSLRSRFCRGWSCRLIS